MLEALGKWLLGVCGAGLIASVCGALAEGKGKGVVKAAGGLLVALAAAAPLVNLGALDPGMLLESYGAEIRSKIEGESELSFEEVRALVEGSCAAYIEEKAAEMGISCAASVSARADLAGVLCAAEVLVVYYGEADEEAVAALIERDLGVPRSMQRHRPQPAPEGGEGSVN